MRSVATINFETGDFSFSASCDDAPINICAVPSTPNVNVGDATYPDIEIGDITIIGDPDDVKPEDLGPFTELPVPPVGETTGDTRVPSDDGDPTSEIDDPNNITTINDFTPETDPAGAHEILVDKTVGLSNLIENQFPQFVREESSLFINFLKSYYESQELKNPAH